MNKREQMIIVAGAIRDQVLALMEEHEREAHEGEVCWGNRVSLLAYLSHCLGLGTRDRNEMFGFMNQLLNEYDATCETFNCPHKKASEK